MALTPGLFLPYIMVLDQRQTERDVQSSVLWQSIAGEQKISL